jgi:hypothetical protein
VLLGIFLIAFGAERLSPAERIYVWTLTSFAISIHLSYVPIAAGLVCIGIRTLVLKQVTGIGWWIVYLSFPLAEN